MKVVSESEVHAALLEALRSVDATCRSLDVQYWLDGGTLLGAVRHGGPIPWDDDIDLCMLRPDYERFIELGGPLLEPKYALRTPDDDPHIAVSAKVFVNGTHINDDTAQRHGLQGTQHDGLFIDIVVLDPMSRLGPVRWMERALGGLVGARAWAADMARSPALTSPVRRLRWRVAAHTPTSIVAGIRRYLLWRAQKRTGALLGPRVDGLHRQRTFRRSVVFPLGSIAFGGMAFPAPHDPGAYLRAQYGPSFLTPPAAAERRTHGAVRFDS